MSFNLRTAWMLALGLSAALPAAEKVAPGQSQLRVQVWRDRNIDGIREANDPPVYNATVNVYREDGTLASSRTQPNSGQFVFNDLQPGKYYFEVQPPPNHLWFPTLGGQGNNRLYDSDLVSGSMQSPSFELAPDKVEVSYDAGLARARQGDWDPNRRDYNNKKDQQANEAGTAAERKDAKRREREAKKEEQKKHDELMKDNATGVDGLFQAAERKFKAEEYSAAYSDYQSVLKSDNPRAEKLRDKARARVLEMEKLAAALFAKSEDARLKSDLQKELEPLELIFRELHFTKAFADAQHRLVVLKTQPDVQALLAFWECERAEKNRDWLKALSGYHRIAENERFKNTLGWIKAQKRLQNLEAEGDVKKELETQRQDAAAKEAPGMLNTVKNLQANNETQAAIEKLKQIVEKFPGTTFAADADNILAQNGIK